MNAGDSDICVVRGHGFRARGLCPRPGMTTCGNSFTNSEELESLGAYRVAGQRWERGNERWLPLYEGKMIQAYDHRAASVVVNSNNLNRPAQPFPASDSEHSDPRWSPTPQFWVQAQQVVGLDGLPAILVFKDVTAPTNVRTMIAAFG